MSEPFLAEIRMVGFTFAPRGWGFCDGQILPINQNQSLYSLLGTTYGGDGRTSFALPDMRGRTSIHTGSNGSSQTYREGQKTGESAVALSAAEMPQHIHMSVASTASADQSTPAGNLLAQTTSNIYGPATTQTENTAVLTNVGGGQSHENMQPYLVLSFCIALQGLFPSRN